MVRVLLVIWILLTGLTAGPLAFAAKDDTPLDLQFIDMMAQHHQSAVDMSRLTESRATSPDVTKLAARIGDEQEKEIQELKGYREKFFSGRPQTKSMQMGKEAMTMEKMESMSKKDMSRLQAASGREFDTAFLQIMTRHHRDGIRMAQAEMDRGKHAEVKDFAGRMVKMQTDEIGEMNRMLKGGGKKGSSS